MKLTLLPIQMRGHFTRDRDYTLALQNRPKIDAGHALLHGSSAAALHCSVILK